MVVLQCVGPLWFRSCGEDRFVEFPLWGRGWWLLSGNQQHQTPGLQTTQPKRTLGRAGRMAGIYDGQGSNHAQGFFFWSMAVNGAIDPQNERCVSLGILYTNPKKVPSKPHSNGCVPIREECNKEVRIAPRMVPHMFSLGYKPYIYAFSTDFAPGRIEAGSR